MKKEEDGAVEFQSTPGSSSDFERDLENLDWQQQRVPPVPFKQEQRLQRQLSDEGFEIVTRPVKQLPVDMSCSIEIRSVEASDVQAGRRDTNFMDSEGAALEQFFKNAETDSKHQEEKQPSPMNISQGSSVLLRNLNPQGGQMMALGHDFPKPPNLQALSSIRSNISDMCNIESIDMSSQGGGFSAMNKPLLPPLQNVTVIEEEEGLFSESTQQLRESSQYPVGESKETLQPASSGVGSIPEFQALMRRSDGLGDAEVEFYTFDDFMAQLKAGQNNAARTLPGQVSQFNPEAIKQMGVIETPKLRPQTSGSLKRDSEQLVSFRVNPFMTEKAQKLESPISVHSEEEKLRSKAKTVQQKLEERKKEKQRQEMLQLKQQALEKEKKLQQRLQAVSKIQKWWRSLLAKWSLHKLELKKVAVQKLEGLFNRGYRKMHSKLIKTVIYLLLEVLQQREMERQKLYARYIIHCATVIQCAWRGYLVRKQYSKKLKASKQASHRILALVQGWKIRRIMKETKEVKALKDQIADIEFMLKSDAEDGGAGGGYLSQIKQERSRKVQELSRMIYKLYIYGRWVGSRKKLIQQEQKHEVSVMNQSVRGQFQFNDSKFMAVQDERPIRPAQKPVEDVVMELQFGQPDKLMGKSVGSSEEDQQFTDRSVGGGPQLDMSRYDTTHKAAMMPKEYGNDDLKVGSMKKKNDIGSLNEFVSEEELEKLRREGEEKRRKIQERKAKMKLKKKTYDPKKAIQEGKQKKPTPPVPSAFPKKLSLSSPKKEEEKKRSESVEDKKEESDLKEVKKKQSHFRRMKSKSVSALDQKEEENEENEPEKPDTYREEIKEQQLEEEKGIDSPGAARPFLKRKSQAIKFQKLNWNRVKRRIDCWNGPGQKQEEPPPPKTVARQTLERRKVERGKSKIPEPTSSMRPHNNPKQKKKNIEPKKKSEKQTSGSNAPSSRERGKQKGKSSKIPRITTRPSYEEQFADDIEIPNEYSMAPFVEERKEASPFLTMGQVHRSEQELGEEVLLKQSNFWEDHVVQSASQLGIAELEDFFESIHGPNSGGYSLQDLPRSNTGMRIPMMAVNSFFLQTYQENIYDGKLEELKQEYEELVGEYNVTTEVSEEY